MSLVQNAGGVLQPSLSFSESLISYLPDEVILNIFLFLGTLDLMKAPLVCKQWKNIVDDEYLWKCLYLARTDSPENRPLAEGYTYRMYMRQIGYMDRIMQHPPSETRDPAFYTYPWGGRLSPVMLENLNHLFSFSGDAILRNLGTQGDLAFFSIFNEDVGAGTCVHIVSLSRQSIFATIHILDPIKCFLLPNNQLIIVTKEGIVEYWDVSQISQPTCIERISLFKDKPCWIKNVVKIQNLLIFLPDKYIDNTPISTEFFVYDLNEKNIFNFSRTEKSYITKGGDEIFLEFTDQFIQAYQFCDQDNQKFKELIWEIKAEENSHIDPYYRRCDEYDEFYLYQHQPDSSHPYLAYEEKESGAYKVINTLNGTELLKIDPSELKLGTVKGGLIANIFCTLSENEINLWLLPSCEHYTITEDVLPRGSKFQNIAWDGQTLVIQLLNESFFRKNQISFRCYDIPRKQSNQAVPISLPKTYFLKVGLTNLFQTIPLTMLFTFGKIIRLITLYHFWVPFLSLSSEKIPYKRRLLDAGYCLLQVVGIPFLVLAKQLAAVYGLISPTDGDQLITKINRKITQLNMNTIDYFS